MLTKVQKEIVTNLFQIIIVIIIKKKIKYQAGSVNSHKECTTNNNKGGDKEFQSVKQKIFKKIQAAGFRTLPLE